jgi:hypothetical protein
MAETPTLPTNSIADQVSAILAQSAREPGINEMMTLMRITEESMRVQDIQAQMALPTFVTQATGTQPSSVR